MKRKTIIFSILVILALFLAACAEGGAGNTARTLEPGLGTERPPLDTPREPLDGTPGAAPEETTEASERAGTPTGEPQRAFTPLARETRPPGESGTAGPRGAEVLPATGRGQLSLLSTLLEFQVADRNGMRLGPVIDYILNMCEAHILYIVLDSDPGLIPFEVVTLQDGRIDGEQQAILLNLDAAAVQEAPAIDPASLDLTTTEWEAQVLDYWSGYTALSLSSECRVPASGTEAGAGERVTLHKIASARNVMEAELISGNGETLGRVDEIVVQPESGWMRFLSVQLDDSARAGGGRVLIPLGAVNIPTGAEGEPGTILELLVEPQILADAPRIEALPEALDSSQEEAIFDYWSQFIPMTREALP